MVAFKSFRVYNNLDFQMRVSDMPIAFLALLLLPMSIYPFSSAIGYLNVHVGRAVSGSSDYWSTSFLLAFFCF